MKYDFYIFTEAGVDCGYGHISRCISLYDELVKREFKVKIIINSDKNIYEFIGDRNFEIKDWCEEFFLEKLLNGDEFAIVDSYKADLKIYELIAKKTEKSLFIDDNMRLEYPEAFILNPSFHAKKTDYKNRDNILLGKDYIILRKEFGEVKDRDIDEKIEEVLLIFGGSDIGKLTPKILFFLKKNYPNWIKNVVLGNGIEHIEEIIKLKDENINFYTKLNASEMKNLMEKSNLAFSASGQTVYELCKCNLPFIIFKVADNQENICRYFLEKSLAVKGDIDNLEKSINELLRRKKEIYLNQKDILKKDGVSKIITEFTKSTIELRELKESDLEDVYLLSNSDYVRKYSYNKEKINFADHRKWFDNMVKSKEDVYYIVYNKLNNNFLGQIRFKLEKNEAIISISFGKKIIGKGLSKYILKKAIKKLKEKYENKKIIAYINEKNKVSIRTFEKLGFNKIDNKDGFYKYILEA